MWERVTAVNRRRYFRQIFTGARSGGVAMLFARDTSFVWARES